MEPQEQEAPDYFASGLDDTPTATPAVAQEQAKVDQPANAEEQQPQEPAPKYRQITEDEWAALETRAAEATALKATLEKVSGTAFGKIGGIERTLQQLQAGGVGEVSMEDFTKLREEFPDLAEMLVEGLNGALKKAPRGQSQPVDFSEIENKFNATLAERLDAQELALETRLLTTRHKDWQEVVAMPEFEAWRMAKPLEFQQRLAGRDSDFIADALSDFKASRKAATESIRRSRIAAAETPRGSGGNVAAEPEDHFLAGLKSG
jgi:hypothetical protein